MPKVFDIQPGGIPRIIARIEEQSWIQRYVLTMSGQCVLDGIIAVLSFFIAHILRFDGYPPGGEAGRMWLILPYLVVARILMNMALGIYRRVWRYSSIADVVQITISVGIVSGILLVLRLTLVGVANYLTVPIGIIIIDFCFAAAGMVNIRLLRRVTYEIVRNAGIHQPKIRRRVLLAGAGQAGIMTLREARNRRDLGFEICGFVDDDPDKKRSIIHGVPVLGNCSEIPAIVQRHRIELVIITMASAPRKTVKRIYELCESANVPVQITPGLYEILGNHVKVSKLRSVQIEDLLGRDPIDFNSWLKSTNTHYAGKKVLVTGAGGSIGRELCRQLLALKPEEIIMLDKDENGLYEADRELGTGYGKTLICPVVADLRTPARLHSIFSQYHPQIVFHAAAHKHVPLMELNVAEAVLNNVVGSAELLKACAEFEVQRSVMVSTDKAVNPTSIMGATKRVAELLFQAQAAGVDGKAHYVCVRFGNVLGSRGSVVPLFREQISNGGPVTVTHPDMVRYFMTIPEAAQLIIQAGALGKKGEIFLLDMGEPVKIVDLACDMIRLSGLTVGEEIEIKFIGARPGEKICEELLIAKEGATATKYDKIFVAPALHYDFASLNESIKLLAEAAGSNDERRIHRILSEMDIGFGASRENRDISQVALA